MALYEIGHRALGKYFLSKLGRVRFGPKLELLQPPMAYRRTLRPYTCKRWPAYGSNTTMRRDQCFAELWKFR
jgi:hypothetical protein